MSFAAQGKAEAASITRLRISESSRHGQVVSIRRRILSSRPPVAMCHAGIQYTIRVIVVSGTQEIERKVSELVDFGGNVSGVGGGE